MGKKGYKRMPTTIRDLDEAPPERARAFIHKALKNWRFNHLLIGKMKGDFPIAILGPEKADAIGTKSRVLRLSDTTAAKQRRRHPNIEPKDYLRIQVMIDDGLWFLQGERNVIVFFEEGGKLWRMALKSTNDGKRAFIKTLHRAKNNNLRNARKKLREIK